jgi:1-acyl-sn-glycerol-3-phosphate acyltransferase
MGVERSGMQTGQLNRAWRVLATGFSFSVFGIGGLLLALTVFPLLRLLSWRRDVLRRRIQRAMHYSFQLFVWLMKSLGLLTYEVQGRERLLGRGQLIIANHPSLIDVVFLISLVPEVDCIVKQALWHNPFLRWPVAWARYIPNREPQALVADCVAALRSGRSLIVFPEGTRTVPGQSMTMKRGAAQIALAASSPIVPVTIVCDPPTLTKAEAWYQVPLRRPHWTVRVGAAFTAEQVVDSAEGQPLAARRLTAHFLNYFSSQTGSGSVTVATPAGAIVPAP